MRKPTLLSIIAFAAIMATCSKPSNTDKKELVGKWRATQQFISPGDMGTWKPWNSGLLMIEFHADGRFETTKPLMGWSFNRYRVVDDNTLMVYGSPGVDSSQVVYDITGNRLTLWLFCIEPCGMRFEPAPVK